MIACDGFINAVMVRGGNTYVRPHGRITAVCSDALASGCWRGRGSRVAVVVGCYRSGKRDSDLPLDRFVRLRFTNGQ
jgi:hypothetical protein